MGGPEEAVGVVSAHESLSPRQFGFKQVPEEEWHEAQDAAEYGRNTVDQRRRVNPQRLELHTGQEKMFPLIVQQYQDTPRRRPHSDPVEIIEHGGKLYQSEGHHRMAAAREMGRKSIRVNWRKTGE